MVCHRFLVLLVLLVVLLLAGSRSTAVAQTLPPLPLPDCVANGLTFGPGTDCEGTLAGTYGSNPEVPRPATGEIALAISTRSVDFRLDADGPVNGQLVTFTFTFPGDKSATGADGSLYQSTVRVLHWRDEIEAFTGGLFSCRQSTDAFYSTGCDGNPVGVGDNPKRVVLVRQGDCGPLGNGAPSCTYKVTWGPYDRRVREPMIFRVGFEWAVFYEHELPSGSFVCGPFPTLNCSFGSGVSHVTFATTPPPPLNAIGTARRRGSKVFELDGSTSHPDVVSYAWSVQVPDLINNASRFITSTAAKFTLDFEDEPGIPGSFFQSFHTAQLAVTDRWNRTDFDFVQYSFLEPAGTEGPLEITSFVLVGVDQDGLATLKATVKNTSDAELTDVYLVGSESLGLLAPGSTPQGVTLAADESLEFTVTVQFDARDTLTISAKAFGTSDLGPVKSGAKSRQFDRDGTTTASTTVTQASQPGDHTLHVASNDGFNPGDYVVINIAGPNVEARPIQALGSLIFDAPLAQAHAVGEVVTVFANTAETGDVVAPVIDVVSPVAGAVVCQGAALAAAFTCADPEPASGVQECGDAVIDGQLLDTSTGGSKLTTIRAWDFIGNVTEKVVAWSVVSCAGAIDAFRCYQAKPAAGSPKFAPILGVRANGFDDVLVDLKKPVQLCAPADSGADGFVDPETHLEAYAIKLQKGQPKPVPRKGLSVLTQLGALVVDTAKPTHLLLPTAEDPTSSPSLSINEVDRFACHQAKLAKGQPKLAKDLQLTVEDQLTGTAKRVTVKKIVRLCAPVGVNGGAPKHNAHLLCLQVTPTKGRCAAGSPSNAGGGCKKDVECGGTKGSGHCVVQPKFTKRLGRNVVNDLDAGTLDAAKEDALCLPALLLP